jgi:hypothetical protein
MVIRRQEIGPTRGIHREKLSFLRFFKLLFQVVDLSIAPLKSSIDLTNIVRYARLMSSQVTGAIVRRRGRSN